MRAFRVMSSVVAVAAVLVACGGGSSATSDLPSNSTSYVAAATAGELVNYTVDTNKLTYSYEIVDSQFGLTGRTGSGTLTSLGNNRYTLSGIPNAWLIVMPNGLLLGAVRDNFGGTVQTVPILGMSNPVTSLSEVSGTYNYLARGCVSSGCGGTYGTINIDATTSSWSYCEHANLTTTPLTCASSGSGSLTALGSGRYAAYDGVTLVGTFIAFNSGNQDVAIIDLKDIRVGGLGVGIAIASTQTAVDTAKTNGSWFGMATDGTYATMSTSGGTVTYTSINGVTTNLSQSVALDSPWTGMGTSQLGIPVLLAGEGVYVAAKSNGYAEIGVKYR